MKHDCFSRCTKCVCCSSIIETGTPAQRAEAERIRQHHWDRVTTERRFVNDALYKSLHEEEGIFFCEIDGMDSAKTILPHFHQYDKNVLKDKCLKIHISCVKYNGARPDDVYYFTDAFPHDSANTITVMYKTLLKVTIYFVLLLVFLITHKWNCLMVILNPGPPLAYYKYRNLRGGAGHQILFTFKLTTHAVRTRTSMSLDFASGRFTLDLLRRSDFHFCLSGKTLATNGRKHTYWLTSELCTILWRYLGNGFTHSD